MIPEQFGRMAVLLVFALSFPAIPLIASWAFYRLRLRPANDNPIKHATYECGVESEGSAWGQFNARYYLFALAFVIFDVVGRGAEHRLRRHDAVGARRGSITRG